MNGKNIVIRNEIRERNRTSGVGKVLCVSCVRRNPISWCCCCDLCSTLTIYCTLIRVTSTWMSSLESGEVCRSVRHQQSTPARSHFSSFDRKTINNSICLNNNNNNNNNNNIAETIFIWQTYTLIYSKKETNSSALCAWMMWLCFELAFFFWNAQKVTVGQHIDSPFLFVCFVFFYRVGYFWSIEMILGAIKEPL